VAGPINQEVLDTPIVEQTKFGDDMKRWLPNIVDNINANFSQNANAWTYFFAADTTDIGGSGAGPINVTVTGLTSSGYVSVTLLSSTNSTSILSVVPDTNKFIITFNDDPGASAIIVYQAFTQQPL
jgi:hypothetical protein